MQIMYLLKNLVYAYSQNFDFPKFAVFEKMSNLNEKRYFQKNIELSVKNTTNCFAMFSTSKNLHAKSNFALSRHPTSCKSLCTNKLTLKAMGVQYFWGVRMHLLRFKVYFLVIRQS